MKNHVLTMLLVVLCGALTAAADPTAYVVNSLGESLSKVNLWTGQVTNNVVSLGSDVDCAPNQIKVRNMTAYVINSLTDEIQMIDLNTATTIGYINLPDGSNPFWMEFYDDRYLYVTLLGADAIAKVDVTTDSVVLQRSVGQAPGQLVIHDHKAYIGITSLDDQYVYGQGRLTMYDCRTDSVLSTFNVGTNPNALAVDADGRLHVCCAGDYWSDFCHVYLVDTDADVILDSLYLGGSPSSLSIGPGNVAYLAAGGWATVGEMYSYDARTLEVYHAAANPQTVAKGCIAVSTFHDETVFVVGFYDTLQVVAPSGASVARYAVGDGPVHVDVNYLPGDIDGDWSVTMGDLTVLIDLLFISYEEPEFLLWRANVDGDFEITMGDLTVLISELFIAPGEKPLKVGPTWLD